MLNRGWRLHIVMSPTEEKQGVVRTRPTSCVALQRGLSGATAPFTLKATLHDVTENHYVLTTSSTAASTFRAKKNNFIFVLISQSSRF